MPKPKSNVDFDLHPGIWCGYIVDEFLQKFSTHPIPDSWGGNSTQRYANAVFVAVASVQPVQLETPKAVIDNNSHLPGHLCRQIGFVQLFAKAPDFFLMFVQYVRKRNVDRTKIELIARAMHFEGRKLLLSENGEIRYDKEIAAELDERLKPKKAIHPSLVGKARSLLDRMKREGRENRLERYREFDYNEMILLLSLIADNNANEANPRRTVDGSESSSRV